MVLVLYANFISCRVGFMSFVVSCFHKSSSSYLFCAVICSALAICSVNCDLCRVIAAGTFLTDVDRLPWTSQSELCVLRATHKFKSLNFVCSPSFFSLPTASRLSRLAWFSRALAFCSLDYTWGKMGWPEHDRKCRDTHLNRMWLFFSIVLVLSFFDWHLKSE